MKEQKENEWSTDLCGCFLDWHSCCLTFWCPCVTFGRIADIVNKGSPSCCPSATVCTLVTLSTAVCCSLFGLPIGGAWIYTCGYRSQLRKQYGLKQTPCHDCLVHWCCESCAMCQEYRELQNRGFDMSIGWNGNVARQTQGVAMAPVVEKGMTR